MSDKEKIEKTIELLEQHIYQWESKEEIITKVLQTLKGENNE